MFHFIESTGQWKATETHVLLRVMAGVPPPLIRSLLQYSATWGSLASILSGGERRDRESWVSLGLLRRTQAREPGTATERISSASSMLSANWP